MPPIKLALSYYAERPRDFGSGNKERIESLKRKLEFESRLYSILDDMESPRTIFILGDYLEGCARYSGSDMREVYDSRNRLNDIQSHGKEHIILRKKKFQDKEPVTTEMFLDDLKKANDIIHNILGVTPRGAGFPYGFDTDLSEDTQLLKGLEEIGFSFISNDTSGKESIEPLLTPERQPHSYKEVGFPNLVQIPTYGWQDVIFTEEKRDLFGFKDLNTPKEIARYYINLIKKAGEFETLESPVYVSFCLHPWAVMEYDPKLEITKRIIDSSRNLGADVVSFSKIADDILGRQ